MPNNIINTGLDRLSLANNYDNNVIPFSLANNYSESLTSYMKSSMPQLSNTSFGGSVTARRFGSDVANVLGDSLGDKTKEMFGDSEFGRVTGELFSRGVSSATNTLSNNLLKGEVLTSGLGKNVGASVAGTASGIAANYIGLGINSLGGDSRLSRGIGQGVSTALGTLGGQAVSNLIKTGSIGKLFGSGGINPVGFGMSVAGSVLGGVTGPSKEYGGKYGNITQTMDSIYGVTQGLAGFLPGGLIISGVMTLNKGLSNLFGSTDGMTKTDAILGSAFMPAPIKWLNMWGSSKTGSFNKLSWQNTEKTSAFMQNAFGNLLDRFDRAKNEAGKVYGTFSQGAKRRALENLTFANKAWNTILDMTALNEYQNIRSLDMTSINNQRYALQIQGGFSQLARGKQGMKIFNNATNHNMGMRLLSAAALIDNKAMILSAGNGVKIPKLQTAFLPIEKSDNIRVASQRVELPFTRKEWKEEQLKRNIAQARSRQTVVSSDNRSALEKLEGQKKAKIAQLLEQRIKNQEAATKAFLGLSAMVTPSYWVEQATGEDLGTVGRLGVDLVSPYVLGKGISLLGKTGLGVNKLARFGVSPYTGKWTQFGNREYRFKPGYAAMNGAPVESRAIQKASFDKDIINRLLKDYNPYEYKPISKFSGLKLEVPELKIDLNNLTTDNFVEWLGQQIGKKVKRIPYKDTKEGSLYPEGFSFVDEKGNEIAHIAGEKQGNNVWVQSSYVDSQYRHQGLGKQMYFDFNDNVFNTYGTTLHSSPYQRVGSTGAGMSPSNRLWKSLRENNMSTIEGEGLNRYDVMVEPSKVEAAYRYTPKITPENAARELNNIFENLSLKRYLDNFLNYGVPITTIGGASYVSTK